MKNIIILAIIALVGFLAYKLISKPNTDAETTTAALGQIGANKAAEQQAQQQASAMQQQYDLCVGSCKKEFGWGILDMKPGDWKQCAQTRCAKYLPGYQGTTPNIPVRTRRTLFTQY